MAQETVILKARQQRTERIAGRFFTVISATAKFTVELDGRTRREVRAGSKIAGEEFSRVSFLETEGVENTIVYDAGFEEYLGEVQVSGVSENTFDEPHSVMPADGSLYSLPGGGSAAFTDVPLDVTISSVIFRRKSFHIFNRASTDNDVGIYRSSDGKLLDICYRKTERLFVFNMDVKLRGIGGNTDVAIYQTLYFTTPQ